MSLAESLQRNKITRKGPSCRVCSAMAAMDTSERKVLQAALDDGTFTSASISRALKDEGYDIPAGTLVRHRKNECAGRHGAQ